MTLLREIPKEHHWSSVNPYLLATGSISTHKRRQGQEDVCVCPHATGLEGLDVVRHQTVEGVSIHTELQDEKCTQRSSTPNELNYSEYR